MPERKDAAENRTLILKTAESLFTEHGIRCVSMHQIAKTAGVGQGTLYRRYSHKGDLCMDLIRDYCMNFAEEVEGYLNTHRERSAEERLGSVLDMWIDTIEKKADLLMTIESHRLKESEEVRVADFFQSPLYRFMRDRISELLAEIAALRPDSAPDPILTAHALICSMAPHGHFHMKREKDYSTQEMKNNYRQMCRLPVTDTETT